MTAMQFGGVGTSELAHRCLLPDYVRLKISVCLELTWEDLLDLRRPKARDVD